MTTLLVSPPFCASGEDIGDRDIEYSTNNPPLGILSLATYLRKYGFDVYVVDMFNFNSWEKIRETLNSVEFDVFGVSIWTGNHFKAKKILEIVKEKDEKIITLAGGPHATVLDEQLARHYPVDYVVRGEGEETLLEFVQALKDNREVSSVAGLTYIKDGQLIRTPERKPISGLNDLPFTDFKDIDMDSYTRGMWSDFIFPDRLRKKFNIQHAKFAPVITSRGCPGKCTFCFKMFNKIRFRSAENVVNEIKQLYIKHHIRHIRFCDDTLNINEKRLQDICRLIISENIKIAWDTSIRAYPLSLETAQLMKESGCIKVSVGVETGSTSLMKSMKKGIGPQKVIDAFDICKKAGIPIFANIIVGLRGETKETINETYQFLKRIEPDYTLVSILLLYPMTADYNYAKEVGFIDDNYFLEAEIVPTYCYEHSYEQLLDYSQKLFTFNFIQQKDYRKILYYSALRLRERIGHLTNVYINTRGFDVMLKDRKYIFDFKRGISKVHTPRLNRL